MPIEDVLKSLVGELQKLITIGNLVGQPMEFEDKVVIPISKIGFGFGTGSGEGKGGKKEAPEGEGSGAGGGAGGGVAPVAAIVIFKGIPGPEGIKILPLGSPSGIGKAIGDAISACAEIYKAKKEEGKSG